MTRFRIRHSWRTAVSGGLLTLVVAGLLGLLSGTCSGFSPERASFLVRVKGETVPHRVMGVFVLPGETLLLEAENADGETDLRFSTPRGATVQVGPGRWRWEVPREPGLWPVTVRHPAAADSVTLNVFVMVPLAAVDGEYLNGYRIGRYPLTPWKGLRIYEPPKGFIEVTERSAGTLVSPHFTLGQFLSKQSGGYPKYVVLRERLLLKLEIILEKVNESGYPCETFHIMSGYRTPYYNKAIGNVKYSRHIFGGAADIFVDENPEDGMMDDLNGDGRCDLLDAEILYDIIDEMYGAPWYERFLGGLARYRKTSSHGPFVHVDVRGQRVRWGD